MVKIMHAKNTMPTIGIVGVTIPGAADCINKINQQCHGRFEKHEHPHIILQQPNFAPIHHAQNLGRWDIVENHLLASIKALEKSGADFAIIPANTVHKVIHGLQQNSSIPVLSMLDIVAAASSKKGLKKIGILGTRWTMADHLYQKALAEYHIEEIIPEPQEQSIVQKSIFDELIPKGMLSDSMLIQLMKVVEELKRQGCDGIALACTELPLVLNEKNCGIPTLDTTAILAEAAVNKVLELKLNLSSTALPTKRK